MLGLPASRKTLLDDKIFYFGVSKNNGNIRLFKLYFTFDTFAAASNVRLGESALIKGDAENRSGRPIR